MPPFLSLGRYFPELLAALLFAISLSIRNLNQVPDVLALLSLLAIGACLLIAASSDLRAMPGQHAKAILNLLPLAMIGYVIALFATLLISQAPYDTLIACSLGVVYPLTFVIAVKFRLAEKGTLVRAPVVSLVGAFAAAWGLLQAARGMRAQAMFLDINTFAAVVNIFFIVHLIHAITHSRALNWLFAIIFGVTLIFSDSRGALLSFFAVAPILMWALWRCRQWRTYFIVALTVFVLVLTTLGFNEYRFRKDITTTELIRSPQAAVTSDNSVHPRLLMWKSALIAWISESPLTGTGFGTYKLVYPEYRSPDESKSSGDEAHNDYIQWLLEGGPILLVMLILAGPASSGYLLLKSSRLQDASARAEAMGAALGSSILALHACVNFIYKDPTLGLIGGLCLAKGYTIERAHSRSPSLFVLPILLRHIAHPLVVILYALLLISLIVSAATLAIFGPESSSKLTRRNQIELANLEATIMPWNPYPHAFLAAVALQRAKIEADPQKRHDAAVLSNRETMAWLDTNKRTPAAWRNLAELSSVDKSASSFGKLDSLSIGLHYWPSNLTVRIALSDALIDQQRLSDACIVLEQGQQWWFLIESRIQAQSFFYRGKQICHLFETRLEADNWNRLSIAFGG